MEWDISWLCQPAPPISVGIGTEGVGPTGKPDGNNHSLVLVDFC